METMGVTREKAEIFYTEGQKEAKTIPLLDAVLLPLNTSLFSDSIFLGFRRN
jgi:hypothetical protein